MATTTICLALQFTENLLADFVAKKKVGLTQSNAKIIVLC